jgi:hypothetical protein
MMGCKQDKEDYKDKDWMYGGYLEIGSGEDVKK